MFTARRLRLIALAALASFGFAQAAVAAMGCATLRADAARGNVAVMPSGEPCDMMGDTPAPLTLKLCAQTGDAVAGDLSVQHLLGAAALPSLQPSVRLDERAASALVQPAARILGPPPLALTQRLRI
jgi:hypothetical protein